MNDQLSNYFTHLIKNSGGFLLSDFASVFSELVSAL